MVERGGQIDITGTAAHLRLAIARTARRLRQNAMGLTPTGMAALATIERCGPMTPSELADVERVKRPTATRILARFEGLGLIERTPDPSDGRSSLVALTKLGQETLDQARSRKDAILAEKMADLPAEDIKTLERAAQILDEMLNNDAPKGDTP
jgi:DNA-binding MarR family transcriptional regulator